MARKKQENLSAASFSSSKDVKKSPRRRRGSSVGDIDVGDTSPSFATMEGAKTSSNAYSKNSTSEIVKKIFSAITLLGKRHTWLFPLLVLVFFVSMYLISGEGTFLGDTLAAMLFPSYKIEGTDQYGKGVNDFYFVGFYAIFFAFLREFLMCCILRPLAFFFGVTKRGKVSRFMEQTHAMFYYGISGPFGLWIMSRTPLWFFRTTPFYENFPHKTHDLYFKIFYLGQAAFWTQQSVVLLLQLEKPRKDFKELVLHHIVTIALIWTSYRFHFTWMGLEVYITMDVSDFFLATSKTLNYLESPLTGPFFIFFMFVWIYLRHYINLRILWSVIFEFLNVGPSKLNWETQQYKCWISQPIVFGLIAALQLINLFWLFLIFRILYRYLFGGVKKDERSDSEDEEITEVEGNQS